MILTQLNSGQRCYAFGLNGPQIRRNRHNPLPASRSFYDKLDTNKHDSRKDHHATNCKVRHIHEIAGYQRMGYRACIGRARPFHDAV